MFNSVRNELNRLDATCPIAEQLVDTIGPNVFNLLSTADVTVPVTDIHTFTMNFIVSGSQKVMSMSNMIGIISYHLGHVCFSLKYLASSGP